VWGYRACLSAVAVSVVVCSAALVLGDAAEGALNPAYFLGAGRVQTEGIPRSIDLREALRAWPGRRPRVCTVHYQ
jgi:hypothetical protein